jgi:hypothetical protein
MRLLWTAEAAPALRGLAMAREGGRILVRDSRRELVLYDARGHCRAQWQASGELMAAGNSADGARHATIDAAGHVCLLERDLTLRWERTIAGGLAVAIDSFGDRVAAADSSGGLHLFDGDGQLLWHSAWPRPLRFLAFVAEATAILASSDFGLVCCCDNLGRCLWRDAPVTHTGSLAASGDGRVVAVARYSDGLCCYGLHESRPRALLVAAPCRLADVSYDGQTFLTAGLDERIYLRDAAGKVLSEFALPGRPVALALSPLADRAAVAVVNGTIHMLATGIPDREMVVH